MKYRKLRIAWSVAWGAVAVLLGVLWVRSYWCRDEFTWNPETKESVRLYSAFGGVLVERSPLPVLVFEGKFWGIDTARLDGPPELPM